MFTVAAVVLNILAEAFVVVISPPLTAISPAVVTSPVRVEIPSIVKVPFAWTFPEAFTVNPVEP